MPLTIAIIGAGRLGHTLARALRDAGHDVSGPSGRGSSGAGAELVLLCVPDGEIAAAASLVVPGPVVGHCSGASTLAPLGARPALSLHPLMTVPQSEARLAGASCAIAGSGPGELALAERLAADLEMVAFSVADEDRAAYHAAASIASNFLVTLEGGAEQLGDAAGVPRAALAGLARAALENWAQTGAAQALTGPIARGDEQTVAAQRAAVAERAPELLALWDALAGATRSLAGRRTDAVAPTPRPLVVRSTAELRAVLAPHRRAGAQIALVPTMGALHEGHLALLAAAREHHDVVVMSLFVNPAQFDQHGDLDAYPRDEARDVELAAGAGADLVYAPDPAAVYPPGFAATVHVGGALTTTLEGEHRGSAHFDGVATIVTKLLCAVGPDSAFFGRKDAQQARVVQQLVADLELPVRIELVATVREPDGLALSSRNARLDADGRRRALALSHALRAVAARIEDGTLQGADAIREAGLALLRGGGAEPEYFEAVVPRTFAPAGSGTESELLLVCAARVGDVRLIDNVTALPAPPRAESAPTPELEATCSA